MKKRIAATVLGIMMAVTALSGCGSRGSAAAPATTAAPAATEAAAQGSSDTQAAAPAASEAQYKIRAGHVLAAAHPYELGLEKFAELVEERTNGAVHVDCFSDSQLGNERDMIEGLQLGTLEMCLVSTAPLAGFTSDFLVFDLPYVFSTTEEARKTVDSEIGQGMLDTLSNQGIKGICYFENGFRNITNSKVAIEHPDQLKGLKIRTMENPIHMASFTAMGADPTPMAFGELFTALQQKTIDGQENPLAIIDTSKFYEVQTYLTLSQHFYAPTPVLMSKDYFDKLPEEYQTIIVDCAKEAAAYERGLLDEMNARLVGEMKDHGMTVLEIDPAEFREAVQPVYDEFVGEGEGKVPTEVYEEVQKFLGK